MNDPRRHAPATVRNRDAIAAVLAEVLPESGTVLEVASGTGEHAVHFARAFPDLTWQPSDPDPDALASIAAYRADAGLTNLSAPIRLDAASDDWPVGPVAGIVCINMIHISPWAASEGLFAAAGRLLAPGAPLVTYGPYIEDDVPTAASNLVFDESLKTRDPRWGLRRIERIDGLARRNGLLRTERHAMPANNLVLVYRA